MYRQNKNNFGDDHSDGFMGSDEDSITQDFINLARNQKQNQTQPRGYQNVNPNLTTPTPGSQRNLTTKPGQKLQINNESFLSGTSVSTNMSRPESKQVIKNEHHHRPTLTSPIDSLSRCCPAPQSNTPKSRPQMQQKQKIVQNNPNYMYPSFEDYEYKDYQQEDEDEYYQTNPPQQRYPTFNPQTQKSRPQMNPKQETFQRNPHFQFPSRENYEQEEYMQGEPYEYYQPNMAQRKKSILKNGPPQQVHNQYRPQSRQNTQRYIPSHTDFGYGNEEQYPEEYDQEDHYDRYQMHAPQRNPRMRTHSRSKSRQGRSDSQSSRQFQQPYNNNQYETTGQHNRNTSRPRIPQQRHQPQSRQYIPSHTDYGYSDEELQDQEEYHYEPPQRNQPRPTSTRGQPQQKPSISKKHQQPQHHKTIKVLVIGATGAGKSSLINLFYVWSQNWTPEDLASSPKRVAIRTTFLDGDGDAETDVKDQTVSQTTKAKLYNFDLFNEDTGIQYTLNFMDTPGLGDTLGIERDDKHLELVMDTVGNTDGLNAILLVMNGADPRINARVKYIMTKLQGMIPDTLYSNLVVLLTNVGLSPNLKIQDVLDFNISDDNVFFYNNEIFALDPSKFNNHNVKRKLQQSYKDSINTLSDMLDKISSCSVKPTKEFIVIKEARDDLKKKLVECNDADAKIYKKKQELQKLASDIANGKIKIDDLHKQLNQTVEEETWESQPTPSYNTTCLTCKNSCHENCQLNETTQQGSSYFQQCWAFNGNENCAQCEHSYTSHVHLRIKYVKKVNQVSKVDPNVQNAISKAKNDADAQDKAHNAIDAEIKKLDAQLKKSQTDILQLVKNMQKVCSRFDYIKEIEACINVLDEQIDAATSDFSKTLNQNHATKLDGLQKTRAKMEKLKSDLVKHLQKTQTI